MAGENEELGPKTRTGYMAPCFVKRSESSMGALEAQHHVAHRQLRTHAGH